MVKYAKLSTLWGIRSCLQDSHLCLAKRLSTTLPDLTKTFFPGAMVKRRAEIEEEQDLEEERMRNARLSVSNEGESASKGRLESTESATGGDVEMIDETQGGVGEKGWRRSESKDLDNGVREERSVREEREEDRVEHMDEEEGEVD